MKRLAFSLLSLALLSVAACAQDPGYSRKCAIPDDNVYRDGHCEMYRRCDWEGSHFRASGICFKVVVDAPEKTTSDDHRRTIDICNDKTGLPRSCQKEFEARGEDYNVEDCLSRRITMHQRKWFDTHCPQNGGMCQGNMEKDVDYLISMDRYLAARECSAPKEKQ